MAKVQFPIDGRLGKDFKVTGPMGPRVNPVSHKKQFHNGTDIWSKHEPCWIEAPYEGKVLEAGKSKAPGGGFGNYVILLHNIDGEWYTTLYAHMADNSLKVKRGQTIQAGTPMGRMGSTGMSTGKHLHWELHKGRKHIWSATGKGFIEPVGFFKALIAKEAAIASAPVETHVTEDTPVLPVTVHNDEHAAVVEVERVAQKAVVTPVTPVVTRIPNPGYHGKYIKPGDKGDAIKYMQQQLGIKITGEFNYETKKAVMALQKKHKLTADGIVGPKTWAALR